MQKESWEEKAGWEQAAASTKGRPAGARRASVPLPSSPPTVPLTDRVSVGPKGLYSKVRETQNRPKSPMEQLPKEQERRPASLPAGHVTSVGSHSVCLSIHLKRQGASSTGAGAARSTAQGAWVKVSSPAWMEIEMKT